MSSKLEHKRQIEHNIAFINGIDRDTFKDWTITVYFYCCVHMIESMFCDTYSEEHTYKHSKRFEILGNDDKYNNFKNEYKELYDLSIMTRYKCIKPYNADLCEAEQYFNHIKKCTSH